jgi:glycosyltransferase involved in cell wall biosynthesis
VHDVTWHQLLDFYPFYARERLIPETIKGGYEIDRLAYANSDRIVLSSDWAAASVVRDYGVDCTKVMVSHFGPNLDAVPNRSDVQQLIARRGHGPCRLLTVAVDWRRKGCDVAVAVARHLHDNGIAVELDIVGCAAPAHSPAFVRSLNFLSKNDRQQASLLERLFSEADFLLLPSRADCSPIALKEAAAYGLPVATTAVGGIGEIIGSETWGIALDRHAPPCDYAAWIGAMWSDRHAYERAAWAAREAFEQRLNWDAFCSQLTDIIGMARSATARRETGRSPGFGPCRAIPSPDEMQ